MTIHTFGHSTLPEEAGQKLLRDNDISTLIDVRSHPTSKWPQWRLEALSLWNASNCGIEYRWWPELGGWDKRHLPLADQMAKYGVDVPVYARGKFPKQRIGVLKPGCSCGGSDRPSWTNQGLWDYQFFMTLPEFDRRLDQLIAEFDNPDKHCAIMCCELLWWKCHRSMIADRLANLDVPCIHLQPKLTPHVRALGNRLERYHPDVAAHWAEVDNAAVRN